MSDNETAIPLSKRELEVLEMVATGASNQQIAGQLVISVNTVKVHLRNVFEKLEVQSRTEATLRAIQEGWIIVDDSDEAAEETPSQTNSYLITQLQPPLVRWQQFYLAAAMALAIGILAIPFIPRRLSQTAPAPLPVIYAQPTPIPPSNGSSTWKTHASMPSQRAGLGLVAFEGQLFAIGGVRGNNQATRLVEIYDPTADQWSEGSAKPTAVTDISGAIVDGKIHVPGGCTNEGQAKNILEIYDPVTDSWAEGENMPKPRCGYGLVAFQDELYLFGGWNGRGFEDTVFVYSPQENQWRGLDTTLPGPRGYIGAAVLDEQIYIVGGFNGEAESGETHAFNPATEEWIEKSSLNEARGGLKLITAANTLYAIGGGYTQARPQSEKYDPVADEWTPFDAPFDHQWRNLGLASIDTRIYAIGGWDNSKEQFMDTVVSYQFVHQLFLPITTGQ